MSENLNLENYTASVFQKTKDLIRDKTRFEPDEVQKNLEQESLQLFSLAADHTLRIHHQTANITGRFLKNEPGVLARV